MTHSYHRQFFVGPMTKNTVDAVIEFNDQHHNFFGFIPSRRQVECESLGGGYVNKWNTESFMKFVGNTLVLRDHGGPLQGKDHDDGIISFAKDINSGLRFLHIDPWKDSKDINDAATKTINLIRYCNEINDECRYEIGTEAAIFEYQPDELENFISDVKNGLGDLFNKVVYCVVQSGTQILGTSNIGQFNAERSALMCRIVKKFGLLSKEHNSDYLTNEEILLRRSAGVDSLNIAPEFGVLETGVVLDLLSNNHSLFEDFLELCYKSGKWKKWVKSEVSREELARICGHYVFSTSEFSMIKRMLKRDDFDHVIREKITNNLERLAGV